MRRLTDTRAIASWLAAAVGVIALAVAIAISVHTATSATEQIQHERARNIREACVAQNTRHDNTIKRLDEILAVAIREHPERRVQILASRAPTVLLINSLAPKHNCAAVVRSQVVAAQ